MIPGPNSKVGWKMWKHLEPWQGARLDFEPMPCVYVCALRQADGEAHLKCKVEVALKQSQTCSEPAPEAAPNSIWAETPKLKLLGIKLCPHAPTLLGIISMKSRSCNAKHVQYNVYIYIYIYSFIHLFMC